MSNLQTVVANGAVHLGAVKTVSTGEITGMNDVHEGGLNAIERVESFKVLGAKVFGGGSEWTQEMADQAINLAKKNAAKKVK